MDYSAYEALKSRPDLLEACGYRHLRHLVIAILQATFGFSFDDSQRACDLEMGYNAFYGWLRA